MIVAPPAMRHDPDDNFQRTSLVRPQGGINKRNEVKARTSMFRKPLRGKYLRQNSGEERTIGGRLDLAKGSAADVPDRYGKDLES
jgi:hypothetical protein